MSEDLASAVTWYRLAAEQGNAEAQFNLGAMYFNGKGVPQDFAEAVTWYRLAAEQGNATAQFNLGAMYEDGRGVPQDFIQAHKWLNLAASRTTGILFEVYRHVRDRVAGELSVSQRNTARKLAQEWQPKSWEELKEN